MFTKLRSRARIDFVPGVRGLVIVRMQAGEEEQDGNALGNKGGVIARGVAALRHFKFEGRVAVGLVEEFLQGGSRADTADINFVVLDAADHVHVEHGHGVVQRLRWILDPRGRAEQAQLFTGKRHEQDSTLELPFAWGQNSGKFQDASGARSVVVGAWVNLADLRRSEGIEGAAAEMVVMGADNDVFVGFTGKISEDVVDGGMSGFDIHGKRGMQGFRKCEGSRFRGGVDLLLNLFQRLPCRAEPVVSYRVFHLGKQEANVFRTAHAAKAGQQIFLAVTEVSIYQDHALGTVIACVDGLGDELGVSGQALISTFGRETARLVAQHDNDFIFGIEAGIVIVSKFFGGCAIPGEEEWGRGST